MANYGETASRTALRRLRPFADGLDADDIADELGQSSLLIRTKFVSITSYDGLSGTDQEWFDIAVGILTAIRLLGNISAGANEGLSKLKTPDFEFTFATPDKDQRDNLITELQEALGYLSPIQDDRIAIAETMTVFGAVGRTRNRESVGRYSLSAILTSLLPSGWGGDRPANRSFGGLF